jgi:hypothetical protein
VATETCFALKGGTAINLFFRDMPRFSVDIDLTYLPVEDRASSLVAIDAALRRIADKIRSGIADKTGKNVARAGLADLDICLPYTLAFVRELESVE